MKRLTAAPNLVIAQMWADLLSQAGIAVTVQRAFASGLAGGVPVNDTLPELWIDDHIDTATALKELHSQQRPLHRLWACPQCCEIVEGPFEQCWNCGTAMPRLPF